MDTNGGGPRNPILVLAGLMLLGLGGIIVLAVAAAGGRSAWLLVVGALLALGGAFAIAASKRSAFPALDAGDEE